jgi:hypothetical protein
VSDVQPDSLEDELFLAMLNLARAGAGPEFDFVAVCNEMRIEASPQQLLAFTSDNDGWRGEKAEGRRHALRLDEIRRPRTISDRFRSIARSDWISFSAFIVSVIALFKD